MTVTLNKFRQLIYVQYMISLNKHLNYKELGLFHISYYCRTKFNLDLKLIVTTGYYKINYMNYRS